jgi:hypothetical protein
MNAAAGNPARTRDEDAIGAPPESPTLIPAERYYSPAFATLEIERLWPRCGSWRAWWTMSPIPATISSTGADHTEY